MSEELPKIILGEPLIKFLEELSKKSQEELLREISKALLQKKICEKLPEKFKKKNLLGNYQRIHSEANCRFSELIFGKILGDNFRIILLLPEEFSENLPEEFSKVLLQATMNVLLD